MSVPFTRFVVLVTLAGHVRGIARPREPAAQERTSRTCVPHQKACNDLQSSPRTTAENFMQSAVNARRWFAWAGQARGLTRGRCHLAPLTCRSTAGQTSSPFHSPASHPVSAGPLSHVPSPLIPAGIRKLGCMPSRGQTVCGSSYSVETSAATSSSSHHPPYPPRHLATSLEFKQLCSLNYERPFSKTRTLTHSGDPSPRQHSAVAERLDLGTALDGVGSSFSFNFNQAVIKTAVLALSGSARHGGIRVLLMAAALSTAAAMPLRPNEPEPDSGEEDEEEKGDGSSNQDDDVASKETAPPAVALHQGGRPGPQPWYFALHVPGQGYGVFSDWDLSAACGAVGGRQNFNKKFRSFEEAATKASFRCPGARVPQFPHEMDVWFSLIANEPAMTKVGGSGARLPAATAAAPMHAPPRPRQTVYPTAAPPRARLRTSNFATETVTVTGPPPSALASSSSSGTSDGHLFDVGDEVHIWWEDMDDPDDGGAYYPAVIVAWGGGDGTVTPPFYVVQHEGGGTEIISPDDPGRHIKRRKKKVTARPSSVGRLKRPRDPPPPPDGAAGTSRPKDGRFVRLHPGKDYNRPHPQHDSSDGGSAGQRGRQQSAAPSPPFSVGEAQCIGAGIVCFHPSLVWAMLPTRPAGSRHATPPLPPCGEPGGRGNSRARPDGDDEYSDRRGDHPQAPMGIIDSQAVNKKKRRKRRAQARSWTLPFYLISGALLTSVRSLSWSVNLYPVCTMLCKTERISSCAPRGRLFAGPTATSLLCETCNQIAFSSTLNTTRRATATGASYCRWAKVGRPRSAQVSTRREAPLSLLAAIECAPPHWSHI